MLLLLWQQQEDGLEERRMESEMLMVVMTKSDGTDACSVPSLPLQECVLYEPVQETFIPVSFHLLCIL